MPYLAYRFHQGNSDPAGFRGNLTGQLDLVTAPDGVTPTRKRLYFPPATQAIERQPSVACYGNRHYAVGGHSANLIVDEEFRCNRQGLGRPTAPPSVAFGGGTTPQICYTRFYDEVTGERGPLSEGLVGTGSVSRTWTNLPTEVPQERVLMEGTVNIAAGTVTGISSKTNFGDLRPGDRIAVSSALTRWARVRSISTQTSMTIDDTGMAGAGVAITARCFSRASHVELWVAVSGALPRMSVRVRLGTTSITEAVPTLALGIAETESFEAMPRGEMAVFYNDRQLIAGVDGHRDTVYLSLIGFPERHGGLRLRTKYNEPIIGMFRYGNIVVIMCPSSSYKTRGWTDEDFVLEPLEPDIGGIGHHATAVGRGRAFVPGREGVLIFNSAFHPGIPTRQTEWQDSYNNGVASRLAYEEGFSVINPNDGTYQFYPRRKWLEGSVTATGIVSPPTVDQDAATVWVGKYDAVGPQAGGAISPPEWSSDTSLTPDTGYVTAAAYLVMPGERIGKLWRGTSKGRLYVEDETQSVPFVGTAIIAPGHQFFGDFGGGLQEGKRLIRVWAYILNEKTAATMEVWPGDEYAYWGRGVPPGYAGQAGRPNLATPSYTCQMVATEVITGQELSQPEVTRERIIEKQGRGFSIVFEFVNPRRVIFIGFGGEYETPGATPRPVVIKWDPPI